MKRTFALIPILLLALVGHVYAQTTRPSSKFSYAQKTAFFRAATGGDVTTVASMIQKDPAWVKERDERNHSATALHVAKTADVAKVLVEHGADLEARDLNHDATPLRWAAGDNRVEVVKYLREKGAKVGDIYLAAAVGDLKLLGDFIDKDPKLIEKPGLKCDLLGDGEHVKDLKEIGTGTALIAAVNGNQLASAKFLLDHGADVNLRGGYAYATPLHHASFSGSVDMVALFILEGAEIEAIEDKHQGTPLQWAVVSGKRGTVKALLVSGARVSPDMIQQAVMGTRGGLKGVSDEKPEVFKEIVEMLKAAMRQQK